MKIYCYNCGAKLEFSAREKPKFCSKCGTPLEKGAKKAQASLMADEPEESESVDIPEIDELKFDFDTRGPSCNKETIGSLMGTLDKDQIGKTPKGFQPPSASKEEVMKEFRREASALKEDTTKKDAQT